MKRITLISLILIYTISSFGIGTRQFYCCGKLTITELTFITGKTSSEGNDCCKTTFQSFKVKDSHVTADQVTLPAKHFTDVAIELTPFEIVSITPKSYRSANTIHGPPLWNKVPIYIFNCVYRI